MSKKVKTLIIGGIVLILLIGVLIILPILLKEDEPKNDLSSDLSELVTLIEGNPYDVEYVHIVNETDDYVIDKQAEEVWGIDKIMDFVQTSYMYSETIAAASNLTAANTIEENSSDIGKFGLKNPSLTLEVKMKDKELFTLIAGDLSPDRALRYACIKGENTVYGFSANALARFYYSSTKYIDTVLVPGLDSDQLSDIPVINEMSVSRPDLEKPIILKEYEEGELSENAPMQASVYMSSPVRALISETPAQTYIYENFGIQAESIVKANPTEEEWKEYGFDQPTSEFSLRYNDTSTVKVVTGKGVECQHEESEDLTGHQHVIEYYYAKRDDINQIFLVRASALKWMNFNAKDIISSVILLPSIKDLASLDVTVNGEKNVIAFNRGEDPADVNSYTAALNGKEANVTDAKSYMNLCLNTAVQDLNTVIPTVAPKVTIQYNYLNGKKDVVDIYVLEDRSCIVALNGSPDFTGRAGFVDKLEKEMANLKNGKAVDIEW